MKTIKNLLILIMIFIIVLAYGCSTQQEPDDITEQPPDETTESKAVYTVIGDGLQATFTAEVKDEDGNYTNLSIQTEQFGTVLIQDSKQYSELTPKIIICDINEDQNSELLVYMQEKSAEYTITEWIYILELKTGQEVPMDTLNQNLEEVAKINLHSDNIRSGISINNRYFMFNKVYFYRPNLLKEYDFTQYGFITKTPLGSNEDVSISRIEDEHLEKTLYEVDAENMTKAMQKWMDNHTAPLVAVQTKDTINYYNWDIEKTEKINITTGQKIDGEEVIIFIGDARDSKTPGTLHTLTSSDMKERECSWINIYSDDNWMYEKDRMSVINIHREKTGEKPYNATALVVNDKAYVFKDWLCDQRYAEIETSDINNDDVDEAVITLSVGHGTGVAVEKTHVVDLATYMEIPYEDPLKIIEERVEIKIKDLNIDVYIDDSPVSTQTVDNYQDDGIGIGHYEQYEFDNNEITAILSVSINKTYHIGRIYINYVYSDGGFKAGGIWYEITDHYGD